MKTRKKGLIAMKNAYKTSQIGMMLIEALVALAVLAIGILGIAKLNTFFIEVGGQAKARTQAVQLAESKLEELRSLMVKSQFDAIVSVPEASSETIYGFSASGVQSTQFNRWWSVSDAGTEGHSIEVFVAWEDRSNLTQQVAVRSVVAWDDPGKSISLVHGGGGAGKYAPTPTGRAKLGEGTMPVDPTVSANPDGLRTQRGVDGKWRLVDAGGNVLLTATVPDEEFSEIAGNVYIDQQNLSALANGKVYVVISDASYCSMTPAKQAESSLLNLGDGQVFKYFSYRCYVGADWYGNIGIVRTDDANTNDRVCVGDPGVDTVAYSLKSDNRHPALSTVRLYRGYVGNSGSYRSTGIGMQDGSYTAATYDGHDFLLTRITGQPVDEDCRSRLKRYDSTWPYEPFSTDAQIHVPVTETAYLYGTETRADSDPFGTPGKFFCFTRTCPEDVTLEPPTPITIHVTVSVTLSSKKKKVDLPSLVTNSGSCLYSNSSKTYDCEFTGAGFTGGTWSGSLIVSTAADDYVCPGGISGTVSPLPLGPTAPTPNTYTFELTSQAVNAGNSEFFFKIGDSPTDC